MIFLSTENWENEEMRQYLDIVDNCNLIPTAEAGLLSVRSNEAQPAKNVRNLPRNGNDKHKNVQKQDRFLLTSEEAKRT